MGVPDEDVLAQPIHGTSTLPNRRTRARMLPYAVPRSALRSSAAPAGSAGSGRTTRFMNGSRRIAVPQRGQGWPSRPYTARARSK